VFDAHEIFADMIVDDYPRPVVRAAARMEARLLPHADHIVTVNAALEAHYQETRSPVTVVMNCREDVAERYAPPTARDFTVLYVGTFHRQRFVFELIQAVQETERVRLKIGGMKALSEDVRRACEASDRTTFLGPVPADAVMPLTRECHLVAAVLDPSNPNNVNGTPNKVFEAMAAGRPVLATKGTMSVEACKWALAKLRDDPALQRSLGENALRAAQSRYNWSAQEANLLSVVKRFGG